MRIGAIGIGQAGGRVVDLLVYHNRWGIHPDILPLAIVVNTAQADLMGLENIPKKDRLLVGQSEVRGHGVGLLRERGAELVGQQLHYIMRKVADKDLPRVDAFLVVAGLGGGTGSGGAAVIARQLREVYDQPTYALALLPSADEGKLMQANSIAAMQELYEVTEGIVIFDNDIWKKEGVPLGECYKFMNHELIKPFPFFFGAGEVKGKGVGVKVVDASDIIATWKGLSYIGHSSIKVKKSRFPFFRKRHSIDELDPVLKCLTVTRNATNIRLSGKCRAKETTRALMLLSGPMNELSMEGFSQSKAWLQNYLGDATEIRGGDYPVPRSDEISATVLLSGFTEIPRLKLEFASKE